MKLFIKYLVVVVVTFFSFVLKINAIKRILISDGELIPSFSENILKYNVFAENKDNFVINAELSFDGEIIEGLGEYELEDGKNIIELKSIDSFNNTKIYEISVFRNYDEKNYYSNSFLEDLFIEGHNINFSSEVYEYNINVLENVTRLNIDYSLVSDYSKVKIDGNSNFKPGKNIIKITVTSKDKENISIYKINVFKEEKKLTQISKKKINNEKVLSKSKKNFIIIMIITFTVILLSIIFYLLFINKPKMRIKKRRH